MLSCGKTVSAVPKSELKALRATEVEENIPLPAPLCSLMIFQEEATEQEVY